MINGNENIALEIGKRCRNARMAHGLSQQQLAERANTTPQNISKFEKNGISDIQWISELSNVLGIDLLKDEIDEEGTVGEIGKELLLNMVLGGGAVDFDYLNYVRMYGMSEKRISHEIFKLERIGMCIREQFIPWGEEEEYDYVFITAKGLITLNNMAHNERGNRFLEIGRNAKSYESLIKEYSSIQEYIINTPEQEVIRELAYDPDAYSPGLCRNDSCYKINFREYIYENFKKVLGLDVDSNYEKKPLIPNVSCYHDVLYRMAFDITNDVLEKHYFDRYSNIKKVDEIVKEYGNYDEFIYETEDIFRNEFSLLFGTDCEDDEESKNKVDKSKLRTIFDNFKAEFEKMIQTSYGMSLEELKLYLENHREELDDFDDDSEMDYYLKKSNGILYAIEWMVSEKELEYMRVIYDRNRPDGKSNYPTEWFTVDEIKEFVIANMRPAMTEEELEIDKKLKYVCEKIPEVLDYFKFPEEWENNGLADMLRNYYGIDELRCKA